VITHIWFTIAAQSVNHLKEVVIRMYWDGASKPSVEVPVGDFFGLNLGQYFNYQSEYLNCSSVKALNSYFAMPFRQSARITATNEGPLEVGAFYSNIDYQVVPALPEDVLYFHAQYRQAAPAVATSDDWKINRDANRLLNTDGKLNYVFAETRGRGHLMGVTLGVLQNQEYWMGEGDDMIFIDDESKPAIIGTARRIISAARGISAAAAARFRLRIIRMARSSFSRRSGPAAAIVSIAGMATIR